MAEAESLQIAANAFSAMARVGITSVVGIVLAKFPKAKPLMPLQFLQQLSRLSNNVFVPALIVESLGSGVNVSMLKRMGVLIPLCAVINLTSFALAHTFGWFMHGRKQDDMYLALTVAIGSPNAISLPIMVLQTLCENDVVNADYDADSTACFAEGTSMLFVYSIGWHVMFWSYGFPRLKTLVKVPADPAANPENDGAGSSSGSSTATAVARARAFFSWAWSVLLSPAMVAIMVGVVIALLPPVQSLLFDDGALLHSFGGTVSTLGQPVVAVNCLVMAASLAHVDLSGGRGAGAATAAPTTVGSSSSAGVAGGARKGSAAGYALLESVDTARCDDSETGARAAAATSPSPEEEWKDDTDKEEGDNDDDDDDDDDDDGDAVGKDAERGRIKAGTGTAGPRVNEGDGGEAAGVPLPAWGSIAALVLCRLVLPPVVAIFALLPAAVRLGVLRADDRLMQLVVAVESASSSAQLIIVSLNQLGLVSIASQMSYAYVYQFVASIFTLTFWVTVSMTRIY
jgi:hypothetical protein